MSRVLWLALLSCLMGLFALTVAACGSDDDAGDAASAGISGDTLTIYSSLPLQGVISGERLALKQAGAGRGTDLREGHQGAGRRVIS